MSFFRALVAVFLVISFFFLPGFWWLVVLFGATCFFSFYLEGLVFALWYDLLYGLPGVIPGTVSHGRMSFFVLFSVAFVILLSLLFRDFVLVGRAREEYLR